jgi:hypothetical protein
VFIKDNIRTLADVVIVFIKDSIRTLADVVIIDPT